MCIAYFRISAKKKMPTVLHYMPEGPPSRAVVLTIRYLELHDIEVSDFLFSKTFISNFLAAQIMSHLHGGDF